MKMKALIFLGLVVLALSACLGPAEIVPPIIEPNEPPIVGFGALHSPNGPEQHQLYEWEVYGCGYDPDGEIVQWVIEIADDRFTVGPAEVGPYGDGLNESEHITYQFPQAGWYILRITAIDNDGESATYTPWYNDNPKRNGQWRVKR